MPAGTVLRGPTRITAGAGHCVVSVTGPRVRVADRTDDTVLPGYSCVETPTQWLVECLGRRSQPHSASSGRMWTVPESVSNAGGGSVSTPIGSGIGRPDSRTKAPCYRRPVTWIQVSWVGMLLCFMVVIPLFQSPDEQSHVDRVVDTGVTGFQEFDENTYSADLLAGFELLRFAIQPEPFSAEDAPTRPVPNLVDLSDSEAESGVNQIANHPPAYYALLGAARAGVAGVLPKQIWQFDLEILLLRLFNVLLIAPLPWIFAQTARNLELGERAAAAAAILPLCIPQLAHIGSSVNNDNLLVLSSSVAIMLAGRALVTGLLWRIALPMAVAAGIAVQTKIFGLLFGPFLLIVCLVAVRRRPRQLTAAFVVGLILLASSWTYVRNLVVYREVYPSKPPVGAPPEVDPFAIDWLDFLANLAANTSRSFWGKFGWLWLPLPSLWTTLLSLALVAALAYALIRPPARYVRIMLIPVGIVGGMYLYTSYVGHATTGVFPAQQGRYLFPALGSAAIAVAALALRKHGRLVLPFMASVAVIGLILSMEIIFTAFWAGSGLTKFSSMTAWSPLGQGALVILALGCLAFIGGLALALWLSRSGPAISGQASMIEGSDAEQLVG